jgi:quinol monooxygenase YgiN
MIKVIAKNYIKEDKIEEFLQLTKILIEETNSKDAGCIEYNLFKDSKAVDVYTFIEAWDDYEALNQHMKAKHFLELVPKLGEMAAKPGETNIYEEI